MEINRVTVAGGGVLGSQIAFQTAFKGFKVRIYDVATEEVKPRLERLKEAYLVSLEQMKRDQSAWCRGLSMDRTISAEEIDKLKEKVESGLADIVISSDLQASFSDPDFVVEAVVENREIKTAFYKSIADILPEHTVVATNTSTLLPSMFAEATKRPDKFLAMHFSNHIWRFNTAEIMRHEGTSDEAFETVAEFAKRIGMIPLKLNKEQPRYILNSLLVPFVHSAMLLLAEGVSDVETIDLTWMVSTGAPFGPFRFLDAIGLRTIYNIYLSIPASGDETTPAGKVRKMLDRYIEQGKIGESAGAGFYSYSPGVEPAQQLRQKLFQET